MSSITKSQKTTILPRTTTVGLVLLAADYTGIVSQGPAWRYGLIAILITATVAYDLKTMPYTARANRTVRTLAAIICTWIAFGTAFSIMAGSWNPATIVISFAPLSLLAVVAIEGRKTKAALTTTRMPASLQVSALLFAAVALLDIQYATNSAQPFLNHEKTFVAIYVLFLPSTRLTLIAKGATIIALIQSSMAYPSATTVIAIIISILTGLVLAKKRPLRKPVLALLFAIAVATIPLARTLIQSFYNATGRTDNTQTRTELWNFAIQKIESQWFLGSIFSSVITAPANINGQIQQVPFHNSWLTLVVAGGLLLGGSVLLLTLYVAWRSITTSALTVATWSPALLAATFSMTANPILDSAETAIFFYVILAQGAISISIPKSTSMRDHKLAIDQSNKNYTNAPC